MVNFNKQLRSFSNLVGEEGPRIPGSKGSSVCFFKEFISAFNVHSISAMSFFVVPNSPLSMKPKSSVNNIYSLQFTN